MNSASQESIASKMRRQFTASEKLRLVKSAEAALATGEDGGRQVTPRCQRLATETLACLDDRAWCDADAAAAR